MTDKSLAKQLADPWWRLTSGKLYKIMIKGEDGNDNLILPFIPNKSQLKVLKNLHSRNIILKARQLGFTTLIAIYFLDCALFKANVRAGMIAQSEDIAKTIFRDKVLFAYKNLPPTLLSAMPLDRDSRSELLFRHNNSSLRVATSMRSGTLQYLHVSEFGKICAKYPERATEVVTGSIPAVPASGVIFIESTAEGQSGDFYTMTKRAENLVIADKQLTKKDYKFFFFPWWIEDSYRISAEGVIVGAKEHAYFDIIEGMENCTIDAEQRAWWCSTRDSDFAGEDSKMWQEYPSTSDEAFQQSKEGCYYAVQMAAARKGGRITTLPYRQGIPVNTFWDIGKSDGTAIWLHQRVGQNDNFIGFIEGWDEPYSYYVAEMQKTGYVWGEHYLPHDGNHVRQGKNENYQPKQMLEQLGLEHINIVDAVSQLEHGIQQTRDAFSNCWFDETACAEGIKHLDGYKKKWNTATGQYSSHPVKNKHTEAADAFRQFAQGYNEHERDWLNKPLPDSQQWI